jgi:hypothetical protein
MRNTTLGILIVLGSVACGLPERHITSKGPVEYQSQQNFLRCKNPFRARYRIQDLDGLLKLRVREIRVVNAGAYFEMRLARDRVDGGAAVSMDFTQGKVDMKMYCQDFANLDSKYTIHQTGQARDIPMVIQMSRMGISHYASLFIPVPGFRSVADNGVERTGPFVEVKNKFWSLDGYGSGESLEVHADRDLSELGAGQYFELLQSNYVDFSDERKKGKNMYDSLRFLYALYLITS